MVRTASHDVARAFALAIALAITGTSAHAASPLTASGCSIAAFQHDDVRWTAERSGEYDAAADRAVLHLVVTRGAAGSPTITVVGALTLTNAGPSAATLRNVVVNLQRQSPAGAAAPWHSIAATMGDASAHDAAPEADVDRASTEEEPGTNARLGAGNFRVVGPRATFVETDGSGALTLTDSAGNDPWGLERGFVIAPGASTALRWAATFDNGVLRVPEGAPLRAEVIASFTRGPAASAALLGAGCRDTFALPHAEHCNERLSLSDPCPDGLAFGCGAQEGITSSAPPEAVLSGDRRSSLSVDLTHPGPVTACACLQGVDATVPLRGVGAVPACRAVRLSPCATATVPGGCPASQRCAFHTRAADAWSRCDGAPIAVTGAVTIGAGGAGATTKAGEGRRATWSASAAGRSALVSYLADGSVVDLAGAACCDAKAGWQRIGDACRKQVGSDEKTGAPLYRLQPPSAACSGCRSAAPCATNAPGPLAEDLVDPRCGAEGALGEQVAALTLNVLLGDAAAGGVALAGKTPTPAERRCLGLPFGDAALCVEDPSDPTAPVRGIVVGVAVRDILGMANDYLATGRMPRALEGYDAASLTALLEALNRSHDNGAMSTWAARHLGCAG